MIVQDILAGKGASVVTITPDATIADLIAVLAEHRIGAIVVSADGDTIAGIVSERDIARGLHAHGSDLLSLPVDAVMTTEVRTCGPQDDISEIASIMTHGRFRHLPVVVDGSLVGIVSIGDVVKKRIDQLETETDQLRDYLTS
jgi:CBS domain-containing protein